MSVFFILAILINFSAIASDESFDKVQYKTTKIEPTIYLLEGPGGNITASIGEDGVLLVDDDFAEMNERLILKLKELKGGKPRFVINTHFHYDHTGGNSLFKNATIIASESVRDRLSSKQTLWKKKHPADLNGLPNLTFTDSLKLHFNGEEIQIIHYKNGHTDGDTVVFFQKSKVLSMGDLYFSGMYPIFHPEHKGSLKGYLKCIDTVISIIPDGTTIVSGHGPISNKAELSEYREMIESSIATVNDGIKKNWNLKKILSYGLNPKWEKFSHGYRNTEQWFTSIYEACKQEECK